jgi:hypothetical protein
LQRHGAIAPPPFPQIHMATILDDNYLNNKNRIERFFKMEFKGLPEHKTGQGRERTRPRLSLRRKG